MPVAAARGKAKSVNYLKTSSVKAVSEDVSPLTMAGLRKDSSLKMAGCFLCSFLKDKSRVYLCGGAYVYGILIRVRGQLAGVSSLLHHEGLWNSGH